MTNLKKGSVLILDFGSQYTQLIARRVRENNVFSEILSPDTSLKTIASKKPKAIILSGGPASVFTDETPIFDEDILNIEVGLYTLTVLENGICNKVVSYMVNEPAIISVIENVQNVSCFGGSDASVYLGF